MWIDIDWYFSHEEACESARVLRLCFPLNKYRVARTPKFGPGIKPWCIMEWKEQRQ